MSHSLVQIWIHSVFSTKDRFPLLKDSFRNEVFNHISQSLEEKNCSVKIVDGMPDHVHLLFSLPPQYSISQIIKLIKGESSHWINQMDFLNVKFAWQVGYGAFSVSESQVKVVKKYIENQEQHHKKMSFQEEYDRFIRLYNIEGNR
ncbi:MAG: IS200/IS605 family transposase [Candidatus Marinimicrobia bacterium]|nr:IS200/IS605 family transposase [Candidatus Neomarinimicrobiota bacterium]